MYVYGTIRKLLKVAVLAVLIAVFTLSVLGFKDSSKKGIRCKFEARIIENVAERKTLVVEKIPIKDPTEKRIFVEITARTIIGSKERILDLDALRVGTCIAIKGIRRFEKVGDSRIMIVEARTIQPVFK